MVPCDGSLSKPIPREILSQPPFQKRKPCLGGSVSTVMEGACGGKRFKPLSVTWVPYSFQHPQERGGEKESSEYHTAHTRCGWGRGSNLDWSGLYFDSTFQWIRTEFFFNQYISLIEVELIYYVNFCCPAK